MRQRLIEFLEGRHEVTPATIAKALGVNRQTVQTELSVLVGLGRVTSSMNSLGVTHYKLAEAIVETKPDSRQEALDKIAENEKELGLTYDQVPKVRSKPFSATRVTGAYLKNGNITITVNRRLNARSFTISQKDFDTLAQIYGKAGVFGA